MTAYAHTVNVAAAPIITIFDDRGEIIDVFMFPICLIFALPCRLYAAWLSLTSHASRLTPHVSAWLSALLPGGWRDDLRFMALAILTLFPLSPWDDRREGRARAGVRVSL